MITTIWILLVLWFLALLATKLLSLSFKQKSLVENSYIWITAYQEPTRCGYCFAIDMTEFEQHPLFFIRFLMWSIDAELTFINLR